MSASTSINAQAPPPSSDRMRYAMLAPETVAVRCSRPPAHARFENPLPRSKHEPNRDGVPCVLDRQNDGGQYGNCQRFPAVPRITPAARVDQGSIKRNRRTRPIRVRRVTRALRPRAEEGLAVEAV